MLFIILPFSISCQFFHYILELFHYFVFFFRKIVIIFHLTPKKYPPKFSMDTLVRFIWLLQTQPTRTEARNPKSLYPLPNARCS